MEHSSNFVYFLHKITNQEYFSFVKFNHGWWDKIVEYGVDSNVKRLDSRGMQKAARIYSTILQRGGWVTTEDVIARCIYCLKHAHIFGDNFFIGVLHTGSIRSRETPATLNKKVRNKALYRKYISADAHIYNGGLWKQMVKEKSFLYFVDLIRNKTVIIVGPKNPEVGKGFNYLENFGNIFKVKNFHFIGIDNKAACKDFDKILSTLNDLAQNIDDEKVILFKAGPLAAALISKLHGKLSKTYMIDMGHALDIIDPRLANRHWLKRISHIVKWYRKEFKKI
tara:strand:- start:36640 stop:37482 length:843 start_codon:yes stop_codon:yes gene_type:complete